MTKRNKNRGHKQVMVRQAERGRAPFAEVPQPPIITSTIPKGNKVVAFLTPSIDGCVDKIIGEYGPLFAKDNVTFVVGQDHLAYTEILRAAPETVVFFRAGTQAGKGKEYEETLRQLVGYCKVLKIPTVYYADDFIFPVNNGLPLQLAANCTRIITPSPLLKGWLYEAGVVGPIMVVPTHVDLEFFDKQPESTLVDPSRLNILIGSTGRIGLSFAASLASYLEQEPERYKNVTLVMVSHGVAYFRNYLNKSRHIDKVYSEVLPQDKYYSLCKSCGVHLMMVSGSDISYMVPPEYQGTWLNSKSPIKYCLAGASNSVFIGTPLAPFIHTVRHGETGLLATTVEEVVTYIDGMLEHPEIFAGIANRARKDVEASWDIKTRYPMFKNALKGVEDWDVPLIRPVEKPIEKVGWLLCGPPNISSSRIEGMNLNAWLSNKGVNSTILFQPTEFRTHLSLEPQQMNEVISAGYDTVVFQKLFTGDSTPFVQKLNACGVRTIFNISDLVEQSWVMAKLCSKIVTTNNYLKSKFPEDVQSKITLIKDAYESPREWYKGDYTPIGEKLRVLWFGAGVHFKYSEILRGIVEGLGMEYFTISSADVKPDKVWSLSEIYMDIMQADIVVIPSELNEFDKCKDENKLVQCMVLGLPVISSPFPTYLEVIKEGVNGFIANSTMDWVTKLTALKDQSLREAIGNQARLDVVDKYNIDTIGEQWLEVLTK